MKPIINKDYILFTCRQHAFFFFPEQLQDFSKYEITANIQEAAQMGRAKVFTSVQSLCVSLISISKKYRFLCTAFPLSVGFKLFYMIYI